MTDAQIRMGIIGMGEGICALAVWTLYRALKNQEKNQRIREQQKAQAEQQKTLREYERSIQSLFAEIEEKTCDTETALKTSEQCRKYIMGPLTGQPIADALLAYKRKESDDRGILLELDVRGFPLYGISEEEYIGLLGNLLDNAMEAAEKTLQPWVKLQSFIASGQWILRVENSKLADVLPLQNGMETTKDDKTKHGLGTKIVKRIVKKQKGAVEYKDHGDSFEVMTMIPVVQERGLL